MQPVIDICCLPFTVAVRDGLAQSAELRDSLVNTGVWKRAFRPADITTILDRGGLAHALMPAQAGPDWSIDLSVVVDLVQRSPDRISGQVGIDPRSVARGVRALTRAVCDYGFVGAHSYPHWFGRRPDHPSYYPFYFACADLDVPIQIQIGKAWQPGLRNVGFPDAIDVIACDFPELKVVCIHTGYPWERELIAIASKHPNVYIGADSFHPRDWAPELVNYLSDSSPQNIMKGSHKVLYGSNYPALSGCSSIEEFLAAIRALGLAPAVQASLLGGNAARVYRLHALTA